MKAIKRTLKFFRLLISDSISELDDCDCDNRKVPFGIPTLVVIVCVAIYIYVSGWIALAIELALPVDLSLHELPVFIAGLLLNLWLLIAGLVFVGIWNIWKWGFSVCKYFYETAERTKE